MAGDQMRDTYLFNYVDIFILRNWQVPKVTLRI